MRFLTFIIFVTCFHKATLAQGFNEKVQADREIVYSSYYLEVNYFTLEYQEDINYCSHRLADLTCTEATPSLNLKGVKPMHALSFFCNYSPTVTVPMLNLSTFKTCLLYLI